VPLARSLLAPLTVFALATAVACGGGGRGDHAATATAPPSDGATATAPSAEVPTATSPPDSNGSPSEFETLRDALVDELDRIGVNIGAVPPDVRARIIGNCRALGQFADEAEVEDLCDAVQQAMDRGDPGLIDLILEDLAELSPG
jgi:hypothetical protein